MCQPYSLLRAAASAWLLSLGRYNVVNLKVRIPFYVSAAADVLTPSHTSQRMTQ
jgi:hypothetical protein